MDSEQIAIQLTATMPKSVETQLAEELYKEASSPSKVAELLVQFKAEILRAADRPTYAS